MLIVDNEVEKMIGSQGNGQGRGNRGGNPNNAKEILLLADRQV